MTGKLKLQTKQSGGDQIFTTTWPWKISMWSPYYHHISATGNLGITVKDIIGGCFNNVTNVRCKITWLRCRYRPAVSNKTILATRQEFFFTKVAPVQSINDTVFLDFWLMLLSWMFISSYITIYFFVKNFIVSNGYILVNTIFECLYMFFGWERGHQLSMCGTGGG